MQTEVFEVDYKENRDILGSGKDDLFFLARITYKMKPNNNQNNCWNLRSQSPYPKITVNRNRYELSHRASFSVFKSSAKGKVIRHKCDNPYCCNPDHLESGTQKDNVQDQIKRGRHKYSNYTHCIKGHEYTSENTYTTPKGARQCRICKKIAKQAWQARQNGSN